MNHNNHFEELKKEVLEVRDRYPHLSLDNCFVVWFLRAFITDDEKNAAESILGGPKDKNIDAIYIDHNTRNIFIVQGKYHQLKESNEKRSEIIALADLGRSILIDNKLSFDSILKS